MLSTLGLLSSNSFADTFSGVDFDASFDSRNYELIDSTKDNKFTYTPLIEINSSKVMAYDYVIKGKPENAYDYIGVVLNTREHSEKGYPYLVVGCSSKLTVNDIKYSLNEKYKNAESFNTVVLSNSKSFYTLGKYDIAISRKFNEDYLGCIEIKRKFRSNYKWQSFDNAFLEDSLSAYGLSW